MTTLNAELQSAVEFIAKTDTAHADAQEADRRARDTMKQFAQRIQNGESTGDRIKDFVIVRHAQPNEKVEAKYRNLEAELAQHVGEFVLMVVRREDFHGCTGFGHEPEDSEYALDTDLSLGIIQKGELILDFAAAKWELPTNNFVSCRSEDRPTLTERNISSWHCDLGDLGEPLTLRNRLNRRFDRSPVLKLEIIVGDEAVTAWFDGGDEATLYASRLVMFWKAAHLLGKVITNAPRVDMVVAAQREIIAQELVVLACKRLLVRNDPNKKHLLKEIEQNIQRRLNEALALGMVDQIILTLNVRQLCGELGIEPK